ncbi:MAG TPA: hypothetical protein GXZ59_05970, partial [Clostridiaceae bacterium]|nr:hypothetical protein [Clostridiaceae bacterium]
PLPHTRFVLTVSDPSRLLLTVRSRVVSLRVDRRSDEEIFRILEEELTSRATGDDSAEEKSASAIGEDRFDEQELAAEVRGDDLKESALPTAKNLLSRKETALSGVETALSRKDLSFYARFSDGIPGRALDLVQGSWFGELRSGAAEIYFNLDKSGELDLFTGGNDFFKENKDQVDTALNIINSLIRDELCLHWGTNDRIVNIDLQDRLQAAYQRKLAILTKRREYKEKDTGFIRWHDEGTEGFNAEEQELHLRLTHAAEVIEDSREALQRNVNFELTITRLLLQLKYVASGEELIESRKDERFS